MIIQKQYARRSLVGYESPYEDAFTYRSITEVSEQEMLAVLGRVMSGSSGRDFLEVTAQSEFAGYVEHAGSAFDLRYWMIAYEDEQPAGAVFAQRYWDKMEEGSLFIVGLVPEYRGKGLAKVIHAKGLAMLAAMGVEGYVGSTDVQNLAMIKTFVTNGCRLTAIRNVDIGVGIVD